MITLIQWWLKMSKIPRSFLRINVFKKRKEYLSEIVKNYSKKTEHTKDEVQEVFDKIKECFEFYRKSLRDILKEHGIILFLPSEILKQAQEENIIEDAEVWLEYIDDLNEIIQSQVPSAAAILRAKVVEKYMYKPQKSWEFLVKFYNTKLSKNDNKNIKLPDNKPEYTPEEMGLSEYRYNEFISFCKQHKSIKYVWLHGSRAEGNYTDRTDIDCVADIDNFDEYREILSDLKYLPVPNRIDFALLKDIEDEFFVRIKENAKIIYRSEDFQ